MAKAISTWHARSVKRGCLKFVKWEGKLGCCFVSNKHFGIYVKLARKLHKIKNFNKPLQSVTRAECLSNGNNLTSSLDMSSIRAAGSPWPGFKPGNTLISTQPSGEGAWCTTLSKKSDRTR
uniref:Uncharacterized protein n=1 Tax=Solanum lycopersicum TaxID=4081 RepID=A0A3Q7F497_SOLLC